MSHELLAVINDFIAKREEGRAPFMYGEVRSYDPTAGTVVVTLQPYGIDTGDIGVFTPWAGSPGTPSGMMGGPENGSLALVGLFDPDSDHLMALAFGYSSKNVPPPVPAGEWWVQHKDGKGGVRIQNSGKTIVSGANVMLGQTQGVDLGDGHDIVRKSDLQAVIDGVNALIDVLKADPWHGNLGAPLTPVGILAQVHLPSASASSIARAE